MSQTESSTKKGSHQPYNFGENIVPYQVDFFPQRPLIGESNFPESETIPDQSLTIKEIMDRHTRGLRTPDAMIGYFDEDSDPLGLDGVDFNSLDLIDKMNIINQHTEKTAKMRKQFTDQEKQKAFVEMRSKVLAEINASKDENPPVLTKEVSTPK